MSATNRVRIVVLSSLIACCALAVGARLYQIQIVRSDGLRARADDQHQTRMIVPAMRGAIVDRNGRPLAMSRETRSLYAHPRRVEQPERAAAQLAPVIGRPRAELLAELRSDRPFVYLRRFMEPRAAERVAELGLPLGGNAAFGLENEPHRVYPLDELAVHVVGFANIDGDGIEGIEREFDAALKGDPRVYLWLRDGHADGTRQLISEPRKKPSDVVLSLDVVLQHVVERELDLAMRTTGAHAASAVLLDPSNGQILALANRPSIDANRYGSARPGARRNRAVADRYEPGSTFKIVPLAAAIDTGRVSPSQRIWCERGNYRMGARVIHDVSPHESLTPEEILIESSNIGMVKIAMNLRAQELHDAITRFGFGRVTGIELPGESPGLLRDVPVWSGLSQASLAFGQEIGVTALQMVSAFGAIANDGVLVPPRIVLGTRDPEGRLHRSPAPPPRRVVAPGTARAVALMMEGVIEDGTGRRAAVEGYRVAGKSGTAQKFAEGGGYSSSEFVASFGGFGPVHDARLALLVVLDSPRGEMHQGGQVAAPVFSRIMTEALRHVRAPNEDPEAPYTTRGSEALLTMRRAR